MKTEVYRLYREIDSNTEHGFYIETSSPLTTEQLRKIHWLVAETYEPTITRAVPAFKFRSPDSVVEIGPRLQIETPFSSNAVGIVHNMGIPQVTRIERTRRIFTGARYSSKEAARKDMDRMTEQYYSHGITSFDTGITPEPVRIVDLIRKGKTSLMEVNKALGLGMDEKDIDYYHDLFVNKLQRNPTDVELFQLGNANSEHSRHWYFRGQIVIDGVEMPRTLMQIVQEPLKRFGLASNVSLVAFHDNAGVIRGFNTKLILPVTPGKPSEMRLVERTVHITCTAETHNHPTFVAPFPGAETGAGGRIRDNCAVGRGGVVGIGGAGYFVGNLFIPGYEIPGEVAGFGRLSKYAQPLQILIEGSNGVSSYGNKIGEPLTLGFCRSFGQIVNGEWREARKPVLYSVGGGHIYDGHTKKETPQIGDFIVRIGGPAFPIGVGGGAASSMTQGQNTEVLDYNSVQRGNAEMEQKVNRVIRACAEMGDNNPVSSIHDQGAGGPSNVLTELLEPLGGKIDIRKIVLGDKTMSVLQIWSAEFQEGYGLLIKPEKIELFKSICKRERVNCEILGQIDGSGKVVVEDTQDGTTPVSLDLKQILSEMPQKTFRSDRKVRNLKPLELPGIMLETAVEMVFKQLSVGSKGHLVHKVDRHVTGLVAQQQCCGIAQIAIADYSVNAQSHFDVTGAVESLGENPIRMLIDPKAGARMVVGEMLTNMAPVLITDLSDVRCRANWMWAAKLAGEGSLLYDAAVSMSDFMIELGIAIDGGKDSLTMSAKVQDEQVKAPGALVVFGYAPVPNITRKVTPDIKKPGKSNLYLMDLGLGKNRLGGSAIAQAFNQIGDESPDINAKLLKSAFLAVQKMIEEDLILSMHDRSDGGLITTVAEMCMASRCGFRLYIDESRLAVQTLFSEELGFVLEFEENQEERIHQICQSYGVSEPEFIGKTLESRSCTIIAEEVIFESTIEELRALWESTSYEIEKLQIDPGCAEEERRGYQTQLPSIDSAPSYQLTFDPAETSPELLNAEDNPRVAILREEGSNGDREMAAACLAAGLQPVDVNMEDLLSGEVTLDEFQGVIFPGGFSYMDVFGSAKGWAATIQFNDRLKEMFNRFYAREDTFSLGVCNGCQLMALLGWVPWKDGVHGHLAPQHQPRFIRNTSGRFESRWVQVEVMPSPSVLLAGMEGSKLGIWVAHGEGMMYFPDKWHEKIILNKDLAPLRYVDPHGCRTEQYPYNPNGSPYGITALCSADGRHLSMMPHPERCSNRLWQLPWMPASWKNLKAPPWLRMFQNARKWCVEHKT